MSVKKKIVIFDFNRTIYNPEHRRLMPRIELILKILIRRGYELYLISTANPSRDKLIRELGLKKYFRRVIITRNKRMAIKNITAHSRFSSQNSFVVGDRVRDEISYGNIAKMKTIWLRAGKFSKEKPRLRKEMPTYTITKFSTILKFIK